MNVGSWLVMHMMKKNDSTGNEFLKYLLLRIMLKCLIFVGPYPLFFEMNVLGVCREQGSIPARGHSHMLVSFPSARFIRRDLPNKPIEAHAVYTQRGGAYGIEARRASAGPEVPVPSGVPRWKGRHWY